MMTRDAEEVLREVMRVVARRGNEIAGRLLMKDAETAALALMLIDEVAGLIEGREMEREVATGDYDLGALRVNLSAVAPEFEDDDNPYRGE